MLKVTCCLGVGAQSNVLSGISTKSNVLSGISVKGHVLFGISAKSHSLSGINRVLTDISTESNVLKSVIFSRTVGAGGGGIGWVRFGRGRPLMAWSASPLPRLP